MPDILKLLGFTSEDKVEFSFEDDNNKINKIEFYPGKLAAQNIVKVMDEMPVKPLRLQYNPNDKTANLYWYKYITKDKILYFQYNQCIDRDVAKNYGIKDYENYPDFEEFSDEILKVIADNNTDQFVIDLRNNTGGDSKLMTTFVSKLAKINKLNGKILCNYR